MPSAPRGFGLASPGKRRIALEAVITEAVEGLLAKRWSPEQVAHELRKLFVDQPLRWLCKESIYQAIYGASAVSVGGVRASERG